MAGRRIVWRRSRVTHGSGRGAFGLDGGLADFPGTEFKKAEDDVAGETELIGSSLAGITDNLLKTKRGMDKGAAVPKQCCAVRASGQPIIARSINKRGRVGSAAIGLCGHATEIVGKEVVAGALQLSLG